MDVPNVARRSVVEDLSCILESAEIASLADELQQTRWTGRPGYPLRSMIGMALAKSLYALPTWTRTVALVREHPALAAVVAPDGEVPSVYACYRFTAKLRDHAPMLERCIADVIRALKKANPVLGWDVAIDASDMPAYANGQRFVSNGGRERSDDEFSDPDASWGHRSAVSTRKGGGFYGYRLHMAVCSKTDLPLAWRVETARAHETLSVAPLLDRLHTLGINPETAALDKGYDNNRVYSDCAERGIAPVIPLRKTPDVKKGRTSRLAASTASGGSPEPTASEQRPSGAVRPESASPRPSGSRLTVSTLWSRARRCAGRLSTVAAPQSSGSSDASRTNARSRRFACEGSSACAFTPTWPSCRSWRVRSHGNGPWCSQASLGRRDRERQGRLGAMPIDVDMVLCEAATTAGNALSLIGGAWQVRPGPVMGTSAIAIILRVPRRQAGRHLLRLELLDYDGNVVEIAPPNGPGPMVIEDSVVVEGRTDIALRTPLVAAMAVSIPPFPLPEGQEFQWRLSVDGKTKRHWTTPFRTLEPSELALIASAPS